MKILGSWASKSLHRNMSQDLLYRILVSCPPFEKVHSYFHALRRLHTGEAVLFSRWSACCDWKSAGPHTVHKENPVEKAALGVLDYNGGVSEYQRADQGEWGTLSRSVYYCQNIIKWGHFGVRWFNSKDRILGPWEVSTYISAVPHMTIT